MGQRRRYLRISRHVCILRSGMPRDPLDGPRTRRSIDFGGRDRRRFLATTKIHASLRTLLSFSETIARFAGEFRREGARRRWKLKAIRVGRVSQARCCVIEHWRKFARHSGPGKDSRGAREFESTRDSGKLSAVRVGMRRRLGSSAGKCSPSENANFYSLDRSLELENRVALFRSRLGTEKGGAFRPRADGQRIRESAASLLIRRR